MKRKLLAMAAIAICLSLLGYGTLAYFTAEETAHNVITSGEISIEVLEWADEEKTVPFPKDNVSGIMPGVGVTKIVEIENTGSNEAFVRVKVEKVIILPEDVQGEPDSSLMHIDFDETSWTKGQDGYYYYNKPLKSGQITEPLFAYISFDADMGNMYQNSKATVNVTAYAVQKANNGSTVFEAAGWPKE